MTINHSDLDYLFLTDLDGASSRGIVRLCKRCGLRQVMLHHRIWLGPELSPMQIVRGLQRRGLSVVAHTVMNGIKKSIVGYASAVAALGFDGVYFDGVLRLGDDRNRIINEILDAVGAEGVDLKVYQLSFEDDKSGRKTPTASGQVDYWDDEGGARCRHPESIWWSPAEAISQLRDKASGLHARDIVPDLGWAGEAHISDQCEPTRTSVERYFTRTEWKLLAKASLDVDARIGVRTGYKRWMDNPGRRWIERLLKRTARRRRGSWWRRLWRALWK